MKPRTFARRPSSIGSNQLSKSRPSTSSARAVVILLIMAWSPARRSNAGIRVANPGDYATQFQPPPRQHLARSGIDQWKAVPHSLGATGVPLLDFALATMECEVVARHSAGDHLLVVGRGR